MTEQHTLADLRRRADAIQGFIGNQALLDVQELLRDLIALLDKEEQSQLQARDDATMRRIGLR